MVEKNCVGGLEPCTSCSGAGNLTVELAERSCIPLANVYKYILLQNVGRGTVCYRLLQTVQVEKNWTPGGSHLAYHGWGG